MRLQGGGFGAVEINGKTYTDFRRRGSECEWAFALPVTQKFFILEIVECSYVIDSVLVKETGGGGGQIVVRK